MIDSNQCPKAHAHSGGIHGSKNDIVYIYRERACLFKSVVIYLLGFTCLRSESAVSVDPMPMLVIALDIDGHTTGM